MSYNNISEMNRRRGEMSHQEQPNSTKPKKAIKDKVARLKAQRPLKFPKEKKLDVAHTVYHDMGYLMAESLGLVSEEIKQLPDVGKWNKPGDLKKRADAARKAGKKPAKVKKMGDPKSIDYKSGGRP